MSGFLRVTVAQLLVEEIFVPEDELGFQDKPPHR
jgi:hypothetical protein